MNWREKIAEMWEEPMLPDHSWSIARWIAFFAFIVAAVCALAAIGIAFYTKDAALTAVIVGLAGSFITVAGWANSARSRLTEPQPPKPEE